MGKVGCIIDGRLVCLLIIFINCGLHDYILNTKVYSFWYIIYLCSPKI